MRPVPACPDPWQLAVMALLMLGAPAAGKRPPPSDWRAMITDPDRRRLHDWRAAWTVAIESARAAGLAANVAAEGPLLQPDAALDGAPPPDGDYRCRVVKLGAQAPKGLAFVSYSGFRCRIAGDRIVKLDGSQRPSGRLFAYDGARQLFLGTMMLGDEAGALPYGGDAERDIIGLVERIGPRRWRLVLPRPRWESLLDVIELVPAG